MTIIINNEITLPIENLGKKIWKSSFDISLSRTLWFCIYLFPVGYVTVRKGKAKTNNFIDVDNNKQLFFRIENLGRKYGRARSI